MGDLREHSSTSNLIRFVLKSSVTGGGLTGLAYNSTGLIISTICDNEASATVYTVAASNVEDIATLGTFAAPSANKCRFKEVDATNHKGLYELQFADARFSVANAKRLIISVSGAANLLDADYEIQLKDIAKEATSTAIKAQTDKFAFAGAGPYDVKATLDSETVNLAADQSGVTIGTVNALGAQAKADVNAEVDAALDTSIPGSPTAGSINERIKAIDDHLPTSFSVVADANNTASYFKTDLSSTTDDAYKGAWVRPKTGSLAGEAAHKISLYNGTSKFITLSTGFTTAPTGGDEFEIITG